MFCDFTIFKSEDLYSSFLGAGLVDFAYSAGSFLGRRDCLVKLECFRFFSFEDISFFA